MSTRSEMLIFSPPAPRTKSKNALVPDLIDGIIAKLLTKEPGQRYQTAGEVLSTLESLIAPAPSREIAQIAERLRSQHDAAEGQRLEQLRQQEVQRDELAFIHSHGGFIEIQENGNDREGWNLVLVRPPESTYGEWRIVETRVSALTGRMARYEPIATEAALFADNLAHHWTPAMHTFKLIDKPLERSDVLKILAVFVKAVDVFPD